MKGSLSTQDLVYSARSLSTVFNVTSLFSPQPVVPILHVFVYVCIIRPVGTVRYVCCHIQVKVCDSVCVVKVKSEPAA